MLEHNPLAVRTVVMIVINLPVLGRFFEGVGVIRRYLCHCEQPLFLREDTSGAFRVRRTLYHNTANKKGPTPGLADSEKLNVYVSPKS
jgi:hypothetical protein